MLSLEVSNTLGYRVFYCDLDDEDAFFRRI